VIGLVLLLAVEVRRRYGQGRDALAGPGFGRIQPSEIIRLALPMTLAWYFIVVEGAVRAVDFVVAAVLTLVPIAFIDARA